MSKPAEQISKNCILYVVRGYSGFTNIPANIDAMIEKYEFNLMHVTKDNYSVALGDVVYYSHINENYYVHPTKLYALIIDDEFEAEAYKNLIQAYKIHIESDIDRTNDLINSANCKIKLLNSKLELIS